MRGPWPTLDNFVDGRFVAPVGGGYLPVYEPATGRVLWQVADSGPADIGRAVAAATEAFAGWSALPGSERGRWLERLADAIAAHADELAALESTDTGKPVRLAASVDIPRAIANLRFFAAQARTFGTESYDGEAGLQVVLRQPLGAVACISPWNLPLYLFTWKIAPALAAGNTVVAKPSEVTPVTAHRLCQLAAEMGFPAGVLNVIHGGGPSAGQPLVGHARIAAVSFTGSTAVGRQIARQCADELKKVSLELGGKNATLVFADADLATAAAEAVRAAFSNQGQICLCGSRVLVEKSIYARFVDAFLAEVGKLRCGDPADPATDFGALVSRPHLDKVLGYIDRAHGEGGRLLTGGQPLLLEGRCEQGWFVAPTVFDQLPNAASVNQQEVFGPLVTLQAFEDEAQALLLANDSKYGLAATLFTGDLQRALRLARGLKCGLVWVNRWMQRDLRVPFGGVGQSGIGREGGTEAMRFFTEARSVALC